TRVGNAEGPIVPERPDVIRRGPEIGAEAVATAQILVRSVDRLGPGVELGHAATSAGVARACQPPEGSGLAVKVLAAHPEVPCDRSIGTSAPRFLIRTCVAIVGIPTFGVIGGFSRIVSTLSEIRPPPGSSLRAPEVFQRVGLAHQLAERFPPLAVVFQD